MTDFKYDIITTFEQVEELEGRWMIERCNTFVAKFRKDVENYDKIYVTPDVATVLNITGAIDFLTPSNELTEEQKEEYNYFVGWLTKTNKEIFVYPV